MLENLGSTNDGFFSIVLCSIRISFRTGDVSKGESDKLNQNWNRTDLFNICVILCRCFKERNVEWVCILFCRGVINYFFRCLLINWLNRESRKLIFTISHLFPTKSLFTDSDAYLSISWSHCLTLLNESWSILRNNLEYGRKLLYEKLYKREVGKLGIKLNSTYPWRHRQRWFRVRHDSMTRWLFYTKILIEKKSWQKSWTNLKRSWPAVSQICSLIVLPSSSIVLILKSTPIVEM